MSIPTTYIAAGEKTSPLFCAAFAQGCGGGVQVGGPLQPGSVALWGSPQLWPLLEQARFEGREFWYGDNAYFGRGKFYRITRNGLQHNGVKRATDRGFGWTRRFQQLGRIIRLWRRTGRHVLLCPNSEGYFRLFGLDVHEWITEVSTAIAEVSDRPVLVRWKTDVRERPLAEDLRDCWAVVAFSSASALDALVAGVPVFVTADFAAAYRMGEPDVRRIESPIYPDDREDFCATLANNQWTLPEIQRGDAWRAIQ